MLIFQNTKDFEFVIANREEAFVCLDKIIEDWSGHKREKDIVLLSTTSEKEFEKLSKQNENVYKEFEDVFNDDHACHILAVSVRVSDKFGNVLMCKRSSANKIGANLKGISATGTVLAKDCVEENPVLNAALRIIGEEFNLSRSISKIKLLGFGIGESKKQPAGIVDIVIDGTLNDLLISELNKNKKEKIEEYFVMNLSGERNLGKLREEMTEIGFGHLNLRLEA